MVDNHPVVPHAPDTHSPKADTPVGLKRWRRMSQAAALTLIGQWSFYGIFRCPFVVPYVSCQSCPVITCHGRWVTIFWGFWLLLPLSAIVFGRAFCGWVCPGGLVHQLMGMLAPFKLKRNDNLKRRASWFKYLGLMIALIIWLAWGQPREAIPVRIGGFFESLALTFEHAGIFWLLRTFSVLGILCLGLVITSAWCRFVCPTGGLLEALKWFSLFKVYKDEKCDDCGKCSKICELATKPEETDCTNCCDCLCICPREAIKIGHSRD